MTFRTPFPAGNAPSALGGFAAHLSGLLRNPYNPPEKV